MMNSDEVFIVDPYKAVDKARGEKYYLPRVSWRGLRTSKRYFRKATEAKDYSRRWADRFKRRAFPPPAESPPVEEIESGGR